MYAPGFLLASAFSFAGSVLAHGGVVEIGINGVNYTGWQPYNPAAGQVTAERPYSSYNPITNAVDPTLSCNDDGTASAGQETLVVPAGATVTDYYTQWPHLPGPYTIYLAQCPSSGCTSVNTNAPIQWFKIYELGLVNGTVGNGFWANGYLVADLKWTATIPSNLAPGYYFIRWETLAIHQANAPQFYPECAQFQITGSGTALPPSEYFAPIPGAWGANDPGVNIDIYSTDAMTETTYLIPGPRVWPGFAGYSPPPNLPASAYPSGVSPSGSGPTPTSSTPSPPKSTPPTSPTPKPTTSSTPPVKPTTTSPAPPSGSSVPEYGQCGGEGYTGSTTCASPFVCTYSNPYYSQCLSG